MQAVRFDHYGDRDVLQVLDVPRPDVVAGEVLVEVRAAGINPGEAAIRAGYLESIYPGTFPSGQGSDLAGTVAGIGDGVTAVAVGDEVLGWSWRRSSQADYVLVPEDQLVPKPGAVPWAVAGALFVAGTTAHSAVDAVASGEGDIVAVSAAAGGVGCLVVQLLVRRGAKVLAIASDANHDWLRAQGATPVAYGPDLEARLRTVAPDGVDAFIDLFGPEYVHLAVALGVAPARINTIIAFEAAQQYGAKTAGSAEGATRAVLTELADLAASGRLDVPIAATFPLAEVRAAFAELEQRHTRGKIVLIP